MQSTLKRGLHAPETTVLQALETFVFAGFTSLRLQLNLAVTVSATKANLNNASEKVLRTSCLRVKHANSAVLLALALAKILKISLTAPALSASILVLQGMFNPTHWQHKVSNDPS